MEDPMGLEAAARHQQACCLGVLLALSRQRLMHRSHSEDASQVFSCEEVSNVVIGRLDAM